MPALRVRLLYLGDGCFLQPAEVRWDRAGRICGLRRARGPVADLALFPGLVDAHAHLQLEPLARAPRAFLPWVRAVLAARGAASAQALVAAAEAAARRLVADGTTAVGEIDSTGLTPRALRRVPLAGRCYQEVTGFHLDDREALGLLRARAVAGTPRCPAGVSPHAPYSVSAALFAAAVRRSRQLSIHTAEVPAEQELLRRGRGEFRELLEQLGRLPAGWRAPGVGAVEHLERLGALRRGTQLVHCQELERGDLPRIAASGAAITVCPGTIAFFGRTAPPVPKWLAAGVPVSLGTDSRASNADFSMRAELRRAAQLWPGLSPAALFALATTGGAAALRRGGLGRLRRGGTFDAFAVPVGRRSPEQLLAALVHGRVPTVATWLRGHRWGKPGAPVARGAARDAPRR